MIRYSVFGWYATYGDSFVWMEWHHWLLLATPAAVAAAVGYLLWRAA